MLNKKSEVAFCGEFDGQFTSYAVKVKNRNCTAKGGLLMAELKVCDKILSHEDPEKVCNILRSFNRRRIRNQFRKKYASQLKRNYELSIHTAEGWCDLVRAGHSKHLIDQCIEPTEENLQKYQEEIEAQIRELEVKYPPKPIPMLIRTNQSPPYAWIEMTTTNGGNSLEDRADSGRVTGE